MVETGEIDWDADVVADPAESYQSLVRSLQRTEGFSLFFVRCVPGDQAGLVQRLQADLPTLHMQRLELKEELVDGNLYQRVAALPDFAQTNVLFISGLEKSLDPYVKSGYGGQGNYYKLDTVPRVLGHLNLQRERFRDDFPFCLVFFLSAFGIKYIARRAPDFFDWRSGIFEFVSDSEIIDELTQELWTERFSLFFVRCVPSDQTDLVQRIQERLQVDSLRLHMQQLVLEEELVDGNLYQRVAELPDLQQINVLFISGLEKSLDPYIKSGYDYYSIVPPVLGHLNSQRERFRNDFPFCFVFLLSIFGIKYIARCAPDFFGWRMGLLEFVSDSEIIDELTQELPRNYQEYLIWSHSQRMHRIREIQSLLEEDHQAPYQQASLWFEQGKIIAANQNYEAAIASYDKTLEIKPDDPAAWNNRGIALSELGQKEAAIASYDKALEIKPDDHAAWYNRGLALFNLGQKEEAIASYDQALAFKPDDHQAWNNRGLALSNLGQKEEAIASYDKAIEFKPDNHAAWKNRGVALSALGRYEEALVSYEQALQIQPEFANAHYNKSCCYGLQGKSDLAIATLQHAITLNSEYRDMAKTDADFDGIRDDEQFQAVLRE